MNNTLKNRLKQGQASIGGWLTVSSPSVAEAMASLGFHWIAIDMEHAPIDEGVAAQVFMAVERHGCAALVRLPSADPYLARRMLDTGATGVIVPVVEDAKDFREFTQHCLFPPEGRRGIGLGRCNQWGDSFGDYLNSFKPVIVPQIETRAGVAAAGALAAMDEVDALFMGPYDLSASLGAPGDFSSAEFTGALETVKQVCRDNGVAAGIHQVEPVPDQLNERINDGFSFIAYGTDMIAMRAALRLPEQLA